MNVITLDNCGYEITDKRLAKLLASEAVVKSPNFDEDGEYYLNCWHNYTYDDICMLMKGSEDE